MKSIYTYFMLFLAGISVSKAQTDAETVLGHVIVKFSPLPLFDGDNTVQFGVEVPFGKSNFSFQQDLGYGKSSFAIWYAHEEDPPNKQTFKSRSQIRYYYYNKRRFRAYLAGEVMFKRVLYKQEEWVGRQCEFGNCGFFESIPVEIQRKVVAVHPRMGWQIYLPKRFTLDMFVGVGFRSIKVESDQFNFGNRRYFPRDDFFYASSSEGLVPSIALGVHLGIALGKFRRDNP